MRKGLGKKFLSLLLVFSLVIPNFLVNFVPSASAAEATGQAEDIIISEYIEGSSYNKAIELYNGTGESIELSQYTLELYSNGVSIVSQKMALTGVLESGDTYVLYHKDANADIKAKGNLENSTVINFNGDDALVLKNGNTVVDSIGQAGARVENLKDVTLVRNSDVVTGDTIPNDEFVPSLEWTSFPTNTIENLGTHTMDGSVVENPSDPEVPGDTSYISVADAIANNTGEATVQGYIVGVTNNGPKYNQEPPFTVTTNIALADSPTETDATKILPVQLPSGKVREALNLVKNPDLLGAKITITGSLEKYFGVAGLKSSTEFEIVSENPDEEPGEPEVPVEIITIAEARSQGTGEVTVQGIVTAKLKNTIHIQDDTAAIAVRPTSLDVQLGDEITISGSLQEYRSLLQLDSASLVEKNEQFGIPAPVELAGEEVNEENESKLAVVKKIELVDVNKGNGWANYTAKAEDGTEFLVRDETGTLNLEVEATYDSVTGIIQQFDNDYQIIPRGHADIIEDASKVQPVTASHSTGTIQAGTKVTLSTTTKDAAIYYTTDGSVPTVENGQEYSNPITIDQSMTIKAFAVKEGLTQSEVRQFTYKVYDSENIQIHDIQGASHESSLKG